MSDGTGQAPKKETVYGGPTPPMDNQAFAKPPDPGTAGTVYGGPSPTQGTVYGGPTPGQGTTYGATTQRRPAASGISPAALNSANWFFYIAGLSLLYTFLLNGTGRFSLIGMGITHYVGNVGAVGVAAAMALFGVFARQGQKWAFLIGMLIYALDGVLLLANGVYFSAAFHGLILFYIFRGFRQLD